MIALMHVSDWSFWAWLAQLASGVAVYASHRAARTPEQELKDLIMREQKPLKFAIKHPVKAIERIFR